MTQAQQQRQLNETNQSKLSDDFIEIDLDEYNRIKSKCGDLNADERIERRNQNAKFVLKGGSRYYQLKPKLVFIKETEKYFTFPRDTVADEFYSMYKKDIEFRVIYNEFLDSGSTGNNRFEESFKKLINIKQQFNYQINSHTGSGKSTLARILSSVYCKAQGKNPRFFFDPNSDESNEFILYPEFLPDGFLSMFDKKFWDKGFINIYYAYSIDQARYIIQYKMKPTDVLIMDEVLTLHGDKSKIIADNFTNWIKTSSRGNWANLISSTPDAIKLAEVDYYISVVAWEPNNKWTLALQTRSKKDETAEPISMLLIDVNEPVELETLYKEKSKLVKEKIQSLGGAQSVKPKETARIAMRLKHIFDKLPDGEKEYCLPSGGEPNLDEFIDSDDEAVSNPFKKYIKKRLVYFIKNNINSLDDFTDGKSAIKRQSPSDGLLGDDDPKSEVETIVQDVKSDIIDIGEHFKWDIDSQIAELDDMRKKNPDKYTDEVIESWRRSAINHEVQDEISKDFRERGIYKRLGMKGGQKVVSDWAKSVKGELANRKGEKYEIYYENYLKSTGKYSVVKRIGGIGGQGHGSYDIVRVRKADGVIEVIQLKCYNTSEERTGETIPIKKFMNEVEMVVKYREDGFSAILFGHACFYEVDCVDEVPIDVDNLPQNVTFLLHRGK